MTSLFQFVSGFNTLTWINNGLFTPGESVSGSGNASIVTWKGQKDSEPLCSLAAKRGRQNTLFLFRVSGTRLRVLGTHFFGMRHFFRNVPTQPQTRCVMHQRITRKRDALQEFVAHYKKLGPETRNKNNCFPQSSTRNNAKVKIQMGHRIIPSSNAIGTQSHDVNTV